MIWAVVAAAALVRAAHAAPQVPTDPHLAAALARFRSVRPAVNPMQHRGVAPPAILSGSIVTPTVSVTTGAATPAFRFKFNAPGYYYENNFVFTGPSGQFIAFEYIIAPPGAEKTGTVTYDDAGQPLPVYTQPGAWTLTYAEITDLAGNTTAYDTDDRQSRAFRRHAAGGVLGQATYAECELEQCCPVPQRGAERDGRSLRHFQRYHLPE
jgi:hypothetical protein